MDDAGGRSRSATAARIEAALKTRYVRYQYVLVDFLAEQLADMSRTFNGDIQKGVILAIIGQVHINMLLGNEMSARSVDEVPPERRGITASRLSDATGIPRETTRRKLVEMERQGWLKRDEGYWVLSMNGEEAVARGDLKEIDARAIKRTAKLFLSLSAILGDGTP